MPPSLRDWLPEDHLAWFVIETVAQYSAEQGLTKRNIRLDEIFADSTLDQ